ncbi:MAG TPA: phenylalanine 4-monooxygenase [Phycisphaerae bacterium]|nr:phenylalanine 4-monooxygenase [Phycisphaerae bacterium]
MPATALRLDPKHPGINDPAYIERRTSFFNLARRARLGGEEMPDDRYTPEEDAVWKVIFRRLEEVHQRRACGLYLEGRRRLGFVADQLPNLRELSRKLFAWNGLRLVPAEGLIDFREFFSHLADREMPCTQYLRHGSHPEYTPEPDVIHDVIGHVPALMNPEYVSLIQIIGRAARRAMPDQLVMLNRIYWFGIEFGLIEEGGDIKAFGAGLFSSFGELEHAFSPDVRRLPFVMQEVIEHDYDPTSMQPVLYVIPSLAGLIDATRELTDRF